jgi:hypothetical protein
MNKEDLFKKIIIYSSMIVGIILIQCSKNDGIHKKNEQTTDIKSIFYGTSFGECMGYCRQSIMITENKIVFTKSGWTDEYKPVNCEQALSNNGWNNIITKIELDSFLSLPNIIGCPDCADGGAEWIKIETSDSLHTITFEFGNSPNEVRNYIGLLQNYFKGFKDCGN